MPKYRNKLPQTDGRFFLADGGFETTMYFHEGLDLPHFATFPLLESDEGRAAMLRYFVQYVEIACNAGTGIILESPTWRANPDWGWRLGYSAAALAEVNRTAVAFVAEFAAEHGSDATPIVVAGSVGPRGDGYVAGLSMTEAEAQHYHGEQIAVFADTAADMVSAMTITNVPEAIGIASAAQQHGLPSVISFTLETDGRLPSGDHLGGAIEAVDDATGGAPAYYMINCAHPEHFQDTLARGGAWLKRLKGLRANASTMSHEELDAAEELDEGDPIALAHQHQALLKAYPHINVVGGCCGTDHRHIQSICCTHLKAA